MSPRGGASRYLQTLSTMFSPRKVLRLEAARARPLGYVSMSDPPGRMSAGEVHRAPSRRRTSRSVVQAWRCRPCTGHTSSDAAQDQTPSGASQPTVGANASASLRRMAVHAPL
eukprot:ctg_466.g246